MPTNSQSIAILPSGPKVDLATDPLAAKIRERVSGMVRDFQQLANGADLDSPMWWRHPSALSRIRQGVQPDQAKRAMQKAIEDLDRMKAEGGLYNGCGLFVVLENGQYRLCDGHHALACLFVLGLPAEAVLLE